MGLSHMSAHPCVFFFVSGSALAPVSFKCLTSNKYRHHLHILLYTLHEPWQWTRLSICFSANQNFPWWTVPTPGERWNCRVDSIQAGDECKTRRWTDMISKVPSAIETGSSRYWIVFPHTVAALTKTNNVCFKWKKRNISDTHSSDKNICVTFKCWIHFTVFRQNITLEMFCIHCPFFLFCALCGTSCLTSFFYQASTSAGLLLLKRKQYTSNKTLFFFVF